MSSVMAVRVEKRTWGVVVLSLCCALASLCLVVAAVVLVEEYPLIRQKQIESQVTILPGHATYEQLQEPTLPIWKSVYFFNLTNPEGFAKGEIPRVEEIGPYAYREYRTKRLLYHNTDKSELTYTQHKYFDYDPSTSGQGLDETDWICTVNLPLVTAVAVVNELPEGFVREVGVEILTEIFDSVDDATLYMCDEAANLAWNFTSDLVYELHTREELVAVGLNYPTSWMSLLKNNSANDSVPSIIHTGVGDINRIGEFIQWNGQIQLSIWANRTGANDINGTEGLFFHPNINKAERLQVFSTDAVRSFPLEWKATVHPLGMTAYRYHLPPSVYESAFTNPDNAQWFSWCPDGLFYVGVTRWPVAPIFGSKPHFLDGDPELREKVEGLRPDHSLHETVVDIEPVTGANLQTSTQFQINLQVNQSSNFTQLMNVSGTLYYPVLYVNEHAALTPEFKDYLESQGLSLLYLLDWLVWLIFSLLLLFAAIFAVFAAMALIVFVHRVKQQWSRGEERPLLME